MRLDEKWTALVVMVPPVIIFFVFSDWNSIIKYSCYWCATVYLLFGALLGVRMMYRFGETKERGRLPALVFGIFWWLLGAFASWTLPKTPRQSVAEILSLLWQALVAAF